MNPFHRPTVSNLLLAACGGILFSTSAFAAPVDEITRAVTANGVADVSHARPRHFIKAFNSVVLRAQPRDLPDYVIAAINLRPELAPNAVAVAVKVAARNWEGKPEALCVMIERIVRAAIVVNPDAAVSIARAGAGAAPRLGRCVVDAAIAAAPQAKEEILDVATRSTPPFAFLSVSAAESTGFSYAAPTLNPGNISDPGVGDVNSPEQPPSR